MSTQSPYQRPSYEVARHGARSGHGEYDQDPPVAPEIRRGALWVRIIVGGIALVAIVATALLGGFDQVASVEPQTLPAVAVDEEFNGGPWLITVESAQIGPNLRDYNPSNEGDLVLQVNVRIAKIDNCVCSILRAIGIRDVPGVRTAAFESTIDAAGIPATTTRSLRDNSLVL